ncbi:MAG: DNAase [Acidimicrobiia bacterium]
MNSYWIDTHCHIFLSRQDALFSDSTKRTPYPNSESLATDTDAAGTAFSSGSPLSPASLDPRIVAILQRAEEAGVRRFVVVGIDPETSREAMGIAMADPRCVATIGLHPNEAHFFSTGVENTLNEMAKSPFVAAIGETGLDFYREQAPPSDQEMAFRFHIELARRVSKPLVIHVREAHRETRRVLEDELRSGSLPPLVMHCFSGSRDDAESYLSLGAFLSFAGPITFTTANARQLREVAAWAPLERCLLETDSPFLSPHPYRGSPNEPARTALVGRELARLKGISEEEVASTTTASASAIFFAGR